MKALAPIVSPVALALMLALPALAAERSTATAQPARPNIARYADGLVLHGGSPAGFSKAFTDSFNIYGGVRLDGSNDRRPEGQFENEFLFPLQQGWTSHDLTENPTFWHVSSFNAANLDPAPGNRGMFSGVEAGASGYTTAPGYGNNWDDRLEWTGQANPTIFTNVRLAFDYNYDLETGYDYFHVDYDSAGVWINWETRTGTNRDTSGNFTTPASFDQTVQYTPFMLSGNPATDVNLRLRVTTDGAWSDEDGLFPSSGAAQVDNIRVWFNGALVTQHGDGVATFEDLGGSDDLEGWVPTPADFAGDFSKVLPQLRDTDPCRSNLSPQLGFIDDGSAPNNAPGQTTGGTTSVNHTYGVIGSWVVNYNGGLSFGVTPISNEWWSPEIAWDDSTSAEDDALVGGAFIRFSTWQHLPLLNGIFWTWQVRSNDGLDWTPWANRNFVYYGDSGGTYTNVQQDVSDLMVASPDRVQLALGVQDLAGVFAFPGTDATPSPCFDNVSFWRYNLGGPAFSTRNIDLFNDGFPNSGVTDAVGSPALMSVRIDMARDISTGVANAPGDSIICDIVPTVPGTALQGAPVMNWVLEANPYFDGVRSVPGGATNIGPNPDGWDVWTGTVTGDSSRTAFGAVIADRWFFDAPGDGPKGTLYQTDEPAMFFPGDVFRYHLSAEDTDGNVTTLPGNTTGFTTGDGYPRTFTVHALPTIRSDGQGGVEQPDVLVINDFGRRGGEGSLLAALGQNGLIENQDVDIYTVMGPSSLVSNGIGAAGAGGATSDQLAGYSCILYESGNLSSGLISDGSNLNGNDKGDDLGTLLGWLDLPGDRSIAHFGDDLASFLSGGGTSALTYLNTVMGVTLNDNDVRDEIGGQATALVEPTGAVAAFATNFVAFGGCLSINQFDSISPAPVGGTSATHEFSDGQGGSYAPAAGVWHEWTQIVGLDTYTRRSVSFPYGFLYVYNDQGGYPGGVSARSLLLSEIINAFGQHVNGGPAVPTDPLPRFANALAQNHPNPFNPSTEIRFSVAATGPVELSVYNVRGERVRSLVAGEMPAGEHSVRWDGRDASGAEVSSGLYLYRLDVAGDQLTRKMILLK